LEVTKDNGSVSEEKPGFWVQAWVFQVLQHRRRIETEDRAKNAKELYLHDPSAW